MMNMFVLRIALFLVCLCEASIVSQARSANIDEWPAMQWWPGSLSMVQQGKLSTDGRFITIHSALHLAVVDRETQRCALLLEYTLADSPAVDSGLWERKAHIAESGNVFVVLNAYGVLAWYRVGDTLPWKVQNVGGNRYTQMKILNDSTVVVSNNVTSQLCRASEDEPQTIAMALRAEQWLTDSLVAVSMNRADSVEFRNPYAETVYSATSLRVLGVHHNGKVVGTAGRMLYLYDVVTGERTLVAHIPASDASKLIRHRFVETDGVVFDVDTTASVKTTRYVWDALPDFTTVYAQDALDPLACIRSAAGKVDTIPIVGGLARYLAQDPRDSTIYASVGSAFGVPESLNGGYVSIQRNALWTHGLTDGINALYPFRSIRDSLVVPVVIGPDDTNGPYGDGYMSFENFRSSRPTYLVVVPVQSVWGRVTGAVFSEHGDTMRLTYNRVVASGCTYNLSASKGDSYEWKTNGFVPGTNDMVAYSTRLERGNCEYSEKLPFQVVNLSPKADRIVGRKDSLLILSSVRSPTEQLSSVRATTVLNETWSHNGKTFRFTDNGTRVVSLHSNGNVSILELPLAIINSANARWWWSHDGNVLTLHRADTIATFDVETGAVLRNYTNIPWHNYNSVHKVVYRVGEIDGRIVVSLPSGCISVTPGLDRVVSVREQGNPPNDTMHADGAVHNAVPMSSVVLYNVLGREVHRDVASADGTYTWRGIALPSGAHLLVYTTIGGVRVLRILL